jgi:O-antigen/teichoic acid export membrane protein
MSTVRRHAKNMAALLFAAALSKLLFLVATFRVVKGLDDVAANGAFQLAYTIGVTVMAITELGLRGYLIREAARRRDDTGGARALFAQVMHARLTAGLLALPAALAVAWAAGYPLDLLRLAAWLLVFGLCDSLAMLVKGALRAWERMEFEAVFSVLGRGAILAILIWLGRTGAFTLTNIAVAHVAGAALELLCLSAALRFATPLRWGVAPDPAMSLQALRRSAPFAVLTLVGLLYLRTGTFVLSKLSGDEAVAFYNTAAKIPEGLMFLPLAAINALIPHLSRRHGDRPLIRRHTAVLVRYVGFAGAFVAVVFALDTRGLILLVSRGEYLPAAATFRILGFYLMFASLQYVLSNMLICLDAERRVMQCYTAVFAANLALNLALVPRFGAPGAAAALIACEACAMVLYAWLLRRRGVAVGLRAAAEIAAFAAGVAAALSAAAELPFVARVCVSAAAAGIMAAGAAMAWDRATLARLVRGE